MLTARSGRKIQFVVTLALVFIVALEWLWTPMKDTEPDALLAELELARAELQRAERESRTYLVRRGVLDQTRLDLIVALKRMVSGREGEEP